MNFLPIAKEADAEEDLLGAVWAYEVAIQGEAFSLEDYLDLAALYETVSDFGVASSLPIPKAIEGCAVSRARQVLATAESRLGPLPEIQFWQAFIGWSALGDDMDLSLCQRWAREAGPSSDPMFGVFMLKAEGWEPEYEAILARVSEGRTERSRMIRTALTDAKNRRSR